MHLLAAPVPSGHAEHYAAKMDSVDILHTFLLNNKSIFIYTD